MINDISNEKTQNMIIILYIILFGIFLYIFYPIAQSYCDLNNIPYGLTLSINSIGFGNELVMTLSMISIVIINKILKIFLNMYINLIKKKPYK